MRRVLEMPRHHHCGSAATSVLAGEAARGAKSRGSGGGGGPRLSYHPRPVASFTPSSRLTALPPPPSLSSSLERHGARLHSTFTTHVRGDVPLP